MNDAIEHVINGCYDENDDHSDTTITRTAATATLSSTDTYGDASGLQIDDLSQVDFDFDIMHRIGVGGLAEVFIGMYNNEEVAIKVIDIYRHVDRINAMSDAIIRSECERVRDEAIIMKQCSVHSNIIDVFGYCIPQDQGSKPLIVMELMSYSLNMILHDMKNMPVSFTTRFKLMRDIVSAIEFLHIQGIVHQDIKASNILVDHDCTVAKLTDFGVAERKGFLTTWSRRHSTALATALKVAGKKMAGTRSYQAPEIILGQVDETSRVAEIYSFGVTLWECLSRKIPHLKKENRLRELAKDPKN